MKMTSKKLWLVGGLVIIIVVSAFLIKKSQNKEFISAKVGSISESIYALGTVTPKNKYTFKVGLTKTMQKAFVREGDFVKKGTLLVDLGDGIRLNAPFDGTVTSLPYNTGENVFPDTPVIIFEDLKDLYIVANLEQQGALRVKKGQEALLNFESIREKTFKGFVKAIFPKNGQFIVHIECKDMPSEILPGMTADIAVTVNQKDNVLMIPIKAITNGSVNISRDKQNLSVAVKTGAKDSEWAEVISNNIQPTDKIIIKK